MIKKELQPVVEHRKNKQPRIKVNTLRQYFTQERQAVSFRRFKKVLNHLVSMKNPEALVIASSIQLEHTSDEEFMKKQEKLLKEAIDLDFAPAMVALAEIYYDKCDYDEAFRLYEKAADLNHAYALKILAVNYERGLHGYEKNLEKSTELRNRSKNGINWSIDKGYEAQFCDYDGEYS